MTNRNFGLRIRLTPRAIVFWPLAAAVLTLGYLHLDFAEAAGAKKSKKESSKRASMDSQSEVEGESNVSGAVSDPVKSRFGFGLSTLTFQERPILSVATELNQAHHVQLQVGVSGTSNFGLQLGLGYRYQIERGIRPTGLQLGGQFRMSLASIGTTTTTALGFAPTIGIYIWPLGDSGPLFTLDAGPELVLTNGSADFRVTSFSNTFGLSIHQYF